MAKEVVKAKGKGVSLDPDDQVVGGGLFGPGKAKAKTHRWGMFDYNGKRKAVPALLVGFVREGEAHTESYTVGNGWKPSEDGRSLIPRAGQSGLNDSCKAAKYLAALRDECGMPKGTVTTDITVLDGIIGELERKPLEKVEGSDKAGSILIFTELEKAPWGKGSKKAKPADDDDDEDASDDDQDEDEDSDDDEDEDEKPAKKKPAAGKKKPAADDDDDEDDDSGDSDDDADEDVEEEATEALIAALDDGNLKLAKVNAAVLGQVKKNPNKKAIADLAASEKFLKKERGWSYDAKTKTVSLD